MRTTAPATDRASVNATAAAARERRLILVTTRGCHFCERARDVLSRLGVDAEEVDVDSDDAGRIAAAGVPLTFLPVLTDGRRLIAYGRFSEKRLRRELVR